MLDRLALQTWPPFSDGSEITPSAGSVDGHCCRFSAAARRYKQHELAQGRSSSLETIPSARFLSNSIQKGDGGSYASARSASDAAILYSLHDYLNNLDSALEAAQYFSDSEVVGSLNSLEVEKRWKSMITDGGASSAKRRTAAAKTKRVKSSPAFDYPVNFSCQDLDKGICEGDQDAKEKNTCCLDVCEGVSNDEVKCPECKDSESDHESCGLLEASKRPSTLKKRVSFADDNGQALTMIKIIENKFLALFEAVFDANQPCNCSKQDSSIPQRSAHQQKMQYRWFPEFCIPARQYASFRQKVNTNMVSLENIHTMHDNNSTTKLISIRGSIKVKNIAYHKRVFLRCTFDRWASYKDFPAKHQPTREHHPPFDAFVFRVPLRRPGYSGDRMEFAVCYEVDGCRQFWDNNNGENYLLASHAFLPLGNQVEPLSPLLESELQQSSTTGSHQSTSKDSTSFRIWEQNPTETIYY